MIPLNTFRRYAVALFRISKPHFLPAAAWYVPIVCVRFFPRYARKKPHTFKCKIPLCRRLGTPTAYVLTRLRGGREQTRMIGERHVRLSGR